MVASSFMHYEGFWCNEISIKNHQLCCQRKNSKNHFPREVKNFPSRGSKKNYVRHFLQPTFICVIILSYTELGVEWITQPW